jgi:hypothetical protein
LTTYLVYFYEAIDSRDKYLFDLYKYRKVRRNSARIYYIRSRYQIRLIILLITIASCTVLLIDSINNFAKEPTLLIANTVLSRLLLSELTLEILYIFLILVGEY